jgi:hypothetical protein
MSTYCHAGIIIASGKAVGKGLKHTKSPGPEWLPGLNLV